MPTGYVAPVESGEITELADFIRHFVPRLGTPAAAQDRYEEWVRRNRYYIDRLKEARHKLALAKNWSDAHARRLANASFRRQTQEHAERVVQQNLEWLRYDQMLRKVTAWEIPTPEHQELKGRMMRELEDAIERYCRPITPPVNETGEEYRQGMIDYYHRVIRNCEQQIEKTNQESSDEFMWQLALISNLEALDAQS